MKRFTIIVLLLTIAAVAALGQTPAQGTAPAVPAVPKTTPAQGSPAPANPAPGNKVAVIDFRTALMDSDAGKAAQEQYAKEIEPAKSRFDKVQKDVVDLQTKLQNAKTDVEKGNISRDIDAKKIEFERAQQDAQRASDDLQQKLLPPVADLVRKTVDDYAKENDLALVIDPTTEPSNVVFAHKLSDITTEIIRRMNAEKKPPAAPTAPAKAN
jgi:outer membrane protein